MRYFAPSPQNIFQKFSNDYFDQRPSDEKLTQEESDDKVHDTSKLTSSDHKTAGITSQSKIQKFIGNIREQFDWLVTCSIMLNI